MTSDPTQTVAVEDDPRRKATRNRRLARIAVPIFLSTCAVVSMSVWLSRHFNRHAKQAPGRATSIQAQIAELKSVTAQHPHDVDALAALANMQFDMADYADA
ncbi:MAG: hypothetical protein KGR26_12245, partial [Cyanobacteria bacterium REEB65]|nr:hypothetical protein [Cyanobacteria bacterium REEB65]